MIRETSLNRLPGPVQGLRQPGLSQARKYAGHRRYKIRGAYYKISTLTQEQRERGLVTASAGNHAQGVAYAAQAAGVPECYYCPTKAEARPVLDGVVRPHATILVKASRGMALEELVDYLLTITGEA